MLIPTKSFIEQNITDLPQRASLMSQEGQRNLKGGCRDQYRCYVHTFALCGPAHGHDRHWGNVSIPRRNSSDAYALYLCKRYYEANAMAALGCSYRSIGSYWLGCW